MENGELDELSPDTNKPGGDQIRPIARAFKLLDPFRGLKSRRSAYISDTGAIGTDRRLNRLHLSPLLAS